MGTITMENYLSKYIRANKVFGQILENYDLSKIPAVEFLRKFSLPNDREKVMGFIVNPDNCFEISKFGHHYESRIVDENIFITNAGVQYTKKRR